MPHSVTRRRFLGSTTAATLLTATANRATFGAALDDQPPVRVDTHLHCFAGKSAKFPYHARAPYRPGEAATPEHLLACMDGAKVKYAIVVHPEPYQDDHRYLEHCLKVGLKRLKGTALLFCDRPGSLEKLPALMRRGDLIALRCHAYAPKRLPPFGKPELRKLWQAAADHDLAMQLHFEPRYAPGFEKLIREFPKTKVIIDHLGRPLQGTPREHNVVLRWSRFKNTIIKLSSLPTTRKYPHRKIAPTIRRLVTAFGPERMIYGGGFSATATANSYRKAFDYGRSFISHLSTTDQNRILGGNAAKLFF